MMQAMYNIAQINQWVTWQLSHACIVLYKVTANSIRTLLVLYTRVFILFDNYNATSRQSLDYKLGFSCNDYFLAIERIQPSIFDFENVENHNRSHDRDPTLRLEYNILSTLRWILRGLLIELIKIETLTVLLTKSRDEQFRKESPRTFVEPDAEWIIQKAQAWECFFGELSQSRRHR